MLYITREMFYSQCSAADFACWILVFKFSTDFVGGMCRRGKLLLFSVEWCLNGIVKWGLKIPTASVLAGVLKR